jgi:hypothetical protein
MGSKLTAYLADQEPSCVVMRFGLLGTIYLAFQEPKLAYQERILGLLGTQQLAY